MGNRRFLYVALTAAWVISALSGCGGAGSGQSSQLPDVLSATQHNTSDRRVNDALKTPIAWQLQAGGGSQAGALQALSMLPNSITIDEGDSITWNVSGEVHTITFLGSNSAPPADPTVPQGSSTFDGSNYVSSGILGPGQRYKLTFTKAGTYSYACYLHFPEMSGTVIVQPAGTPYPHQQDYYTNILNDQLSSTLNQAGQSVGSIPYPIGGTTLAMGVSAGTRPEARQTQPCYGFLMGISSPPPAPRYT